MSRRLLLALAGSCALLTSQALVRGQYPPSSCPPGYPAYPYAPSYPPPGSYYYPPTYQQMPAYPQQTPSFPGTTPLPAPTPAMPAPFMPGPMNQFPSAPLPTPQPAPGNVPTPAPPGNFPPSMIPTPSPAPAPGNRSPSVPPPAPAPGNGAPSAQTPSAPANTPPAASALSTSAPSGATAPPAPQPGANSPLAGAGAGMGEGGAGRGGDESADVGRRGTSGSAGLPTVGDFFGVRYRHAFVLPISRTIDYSLFNSNATSATTVTLAPVRSGGVSLATTVTGAFGTVPVPAGQVTNVTLAPGGNATVTATGVVPTAASFIDYAASRGAIKISDFETPRPRDRFYVGGWYYNNIPDNIRVVPGSTRTLVDQPIYGNSPEIVSSLVGNTGTFFDANQLDQLNTAFQRNHAQLVREVADFEKTLELGGIDGSFGMRLPMYQFISDDSFKDIGDLSLIWKAVVVGGFDTEDLVTIGLMVTLPTGQKLITPQGDIKSVLVQPWMGYYYTLKKCYLQGFTGVVIPSDSKDVGFSYTSMALGYRLYESCKSDPLISLVAVQGELYVTTPFENPNPNSVVLVNNFFVGSVAAHVGFGDHAMLTVGCGSPFGGYRPFDFEASAMLNLYF